MLIPEIIILGGLGILGLAIFTAVRKKRISEVVQHLYAFAEKQGGKISTLDETNNLAIGLSEPTNDVFFCKMTGNENTYVHINISEIKSVLLKKTTFRRHDGDDGINNITLVFHNKDTAKSVREFEFYNLNSDSLSIYRELELALKWKKIVSDRLAGPSS